MRQLPDTVSGEGSHFALAEVDDVGGAKDQHQRKRKGRIDGAGGEPADDNLHKKGQAQSPNGKAVATDPPPLASTALANGGLAVEDGLMVGTTIRNGSPAVS